MGSCHGRPACQEFPEGQRETSLAQFEIAPPAIPSLGGVRPILVSIHTHLVRLHGLPELSLEPTRTGFASSRGHDYARRNTRILRHPAARTSVARGGLPRPSGRWPLKPLWVGCLHYEISSALENTNALFPLTNTNPRSSKFGMLRGCQSRLGALVNGVLCAPIVDSLLAETKIVGDVLYGLTGFEQVEHLLAKSSRILTHHEFLSVESPPLFHQTDSEKPRAHQNLRQTQDGSCVKPENLGGP